MSRSPGGPSDKPSIQDFASLRSGDSQVSLQQVMEPDEDEEEDAYENKAQDIQEVWFPGCHAVGNSIFTDERRLMCSRTLEVGGQSPKAKKYP